ncbi:MAG TPA: Rieske 2Fe-2S domain-containing protein, partial [Candidatus Acidoferrales bacterium]|nr:Rieske 2Fe-2S domain-containing protein [Candidatus Acidoferrales bacterium]
MPQRLWPSADTTRIPFWVYTDPEIYKREQERIFGASFWSYVALSTEIPRAGDFKRSYIGDKSVVVIRDHDGSPRVVANRCAHRGLAFCTESFGKAKEIMCPYHQWTYDLCGNLKAVPLRRGLRQQGGMPEDFRLDEHGLQKLAVVERNGVVFASFGEPLPFEEELGATMLNYFDRVFDGRALRVLGYLRQRIQGNWKLMFENIKDPYHASLLHVFLVTFGLFRADQPSEVRMDASGRHACLIS